MSLRLRFGLTLALLVVPFGLGVAWYQARNHEEAIRLSVADQLLSRVGPRERALCEAAPNRWPSWRGGFGARRGGGRRGRLFAYGPDFKSAHPDAPPFPRNLRSGLAREGFASRRVADGVDVAVQMPWRTGPCAILMTHRPLGPRESGASPVFSALLIGVAAVALAVLAAGPVVSRLTRLTLLIRSNGDLSPLKGPDEIGELAEAFAERAKRLEARAEESHRQEEAIRRYVANTSHDVMIPLTVLQGHLAALSRQVQANQSVEPQRLQEAIEECDYLGSLFRNLNVGAKLDASTGPLVMRPVDLGAMVERIVLRHRVLAHEAQVSLNHAVPEEPIFAPGDVTLLEQATSNLVQNAVRYNRADGHVAVVLDRLPTAETFSLVVVDDGPGLSEEDLSRVTERGYRGARARTQRPSGLGLGLSIVQEVSERHGFALKFSSEAAGGLRVELTGNAVQSGGTGAMHASDQERAADYPSESG